MQAVKLTQPVTQTRSPLPQGTLRIEHAISLIWVEQCMATPINYLIGSALTALANAGITVRLISQASASGNFCLVIARRDAEAAFETLWALCSDVSARLTLRNDVVLLNARRVTPNAASAQGESLLTQATFALDAHNVRALAIQAQAACGVALVIAQADWCCAAVALRQVLLGGGEL